MTEPEEIIRIRISTAVALLIIVLGIGIPIFLWGLDAVQATLHLFTF